MGHEVMHFMLKQGGSFTKQSLREDRCPAFWRRCPFHTCSAEGMTAEQLIDLLEAKGGICGDRQRLQHPIGQDLRALIGRRSMPW